MIKLGRLLGAANRARLGVYLLALWKLFKHPDTPRAPRWIAIAVVAYALSPIDLTPTSSRCWASSTTWCWCRSASHWP